MGRFSTVHTYREGQNSWTTPTGLVTFFSNDMYQSWWEFQTIANLGILQL